MVSEIRYFDLFLCINLHKKVIDFLLADDYILIHGLGEDTSFEIETESTLKIGRDKGKVQAFIS